MSSRCANPLLIVLTNSQKCGGVHCQLQSEGRGYGITRKHSKQLWLGVSLESVSVQEFVADVGVFPSSVFCTRL